MSNASMLSDVCNVILGVVWCGGVVCRRNGRSLKGWAAIRIGRNPIAIESGHRAAAIKFGRGCETGHQTDIAHRTGPSHWQSVSSVVDSASTAGCEETGAVDSVGWYDRRATARRSRSGRVGWCHASERRENCLR